MTHRESLSWLSAGRYVSDGGLETDLIFNRGIDLPEFASFPLVEDERGRGLLRDYYDGYAAVARKAGAPTKFFSSTNPDFYQIFKTEQGLDIMRNTNITVRDRVKDFQVKAGGGKIAKLFDGTERVVSIDSFHWYNRAIYLP